MKHVVVLLIAAAFATPAAAQWQNPANAPPPPWAAQIAPTRERLLRELRDPGSAQFRNVQVLQANQGNRGYTFCGEVNSKNGFGGYAGFKRFIADPQMTVVNEALIPNAWPQFCEGDRYKTLIGQVDF